MRCSMIANIGTGLCCAFTQLIQGKVVVTYVEGRCLLQIEEQYSTG